MGYYAFEQGGGFIAAAPGGSEVLRVRRTCAPCFHRFTLALYAATPKTRGGGGSFRLARLFVDVFPLSFGIIGVSCLCIEVYWLVHPRCLCVISCAYNAVRSAALRVHWLSPYDIAQSHRNAEMYPVGFKKTCGGLLDGSVILELHES